MTDRILSVHSITPSTMSIACRLSMSLAQRQTDEADGTRPETDKAVAPATAAADLSETAPDRAPGTGAPPGMSKLLTVSEAESAQSIGTAGLASRAYAEVQKLVEPAA